MNNSRALVATLICSLALTSRKLLSGSTSDGTSLEDSRSNPSSGTDPDSTPAPAACTSAVVSSFTTTGGGAANDLFDTRRVAVSFTLSSAQIVSGVSLNLTADTNTPGSVSVHLEGNSGGQPSGTVLGSNPAAQVSASSLPGYLTTDSMNAVFDFATPVSLNPGTYWIVAGASGGMTAIGSHVYPGFKGTVGTNAFYSNNGGAWTGFTQYTMRYEVRACQ